MIKPLSVCSLLLGLVLLASDIYANKVIDNLKDFVEINTHRAPPDGPTKSSVRLSAKASLDASSLICGRFDPKAAVDYALSGIEETMSTIESIPQTTLASLPGVVLCRALPGVCELAQEYTARFESRFNFAVKSCEQMVADASADKNPYQDVIGVTIERAWQEGQKSGKTPTQTQQDIDKERNKGIVWLGGARHGGHRQRQIRPVRHAIAAGWCMLNSAKANCETSTLENEYTRTWKTTTALKQWISDVVGDVGFWIYQGAPPPHSYPGLGLAPKISERERWVKEKIKTLIALSEQDIYAIAAEDLARLSSRKHRMLPQILAALRNDPDRDWLLDRFANEIAVAQTLDKALLAKRLLMVGCQEPNLYSHKKFIKRTIDEALERLKDEIQHLLVESEAYNRVVSAVAVRILGRETQRQRTRLNSLPTMRILSPIPSAIPSPNLRGAP